MFKVTPERDTFSGNHVRQVSGKTFLCAIEITANGVPVMPSLQLAAFAVAFANRKNNTCINHSITVSVQRYHLLNVVKSVKQRGEVEADRRYRY